MTEEEIKAMQDKIAELTEANQKITQNRDDILGEKRNVQSLVAEKEQAMQSLAEDKLKLSGDMEGLKAHYSKENAEAMAKLQDALDGERNSNRKNSYDKEFNSVSDMFHDDHKLAGKAILAGALNISYNDNGEKQTSYMHDGVEVAKTAEDFKAYAVLSNDFKRYLKGVDSSGANVTPSQGVSNTNGNDTQTKLAQRLKGHGL